MKISHINIKNYRCFKELDLPINEYSVFVGPNGSGKSSVLYALKWFFDGGMLEPSDVHALSNEEEVQAHSDKELGENPTLNTVEVTVTFTALTDKDKSKLGQYGRSSNATFRRSWRQDEMKEKVVGNATQGQGFAEVRMMKAVGDFRPAYNELRTTHTDLPDLGARPTKEVVLQALLNWEDNPVNKSKLIEVDDADANHMFGINGPNVIKDCLRMVLIPASGDMVEEVGGNKKGSALNELIGSLMSNAGAAAREAWISNNSDTIDELTNSMRTSVKDSTGLQAERVNERLLQFVPNTTVDFNTDVPSWVPNPIPSIRTDVTIDGATNDVSRQGHGIQRAIMIAMFQSLVPDEKLVRELHKADDGETDEDAQDRLMELLKDLPALLICIEEPEIYQHPVRARAFARALADLSSQPNAQVLLATHSPYFVRPPQFESLRRFSLSKGIADVKHTKIIDVSSAASTTEPKVRKIVDLRLPSTFSEGFFSDAVVLVEGSTDKVVFESLAEKIDKPLDTAGISILEMSGKDALQIPYALLSKFDTPAYLLVDGDALGASRKFPDDAGKMRDSHNSHKASTEAILTWLPSSTSIEGSLPYKFEDETVVTKHYTIWNDDIEEELNNWPSFIAALNANGCTLRGKDLLAYKSAVMEADIKDAPKILISCINAILDFRNI